MEDRVSRLEGAYEHVATKADIGEVKADIAELRVESKTDIAEVKADIAELRAESKTNIAEVKAEIAELRAEMRAGFAELRTDIRTNATDLKSDVSVQMQGHIRWVGMYVLVGLLGGLALLGAIFRYA